MFDDERPDYWRTFSQDDLALRCAVLHAERRQSAGAALAARIEGARFAIASLYLEGAGLEVGAGTRPYPVPDHVHVTYGDIRDSGALRNYFNSEVIDQGSIDAQTFFGIENGSQNFVISAHVIEHLQDPVGSIVHAMRVLKTDGIYILVVPDMRYTFDSDRPETTVEHVASDYADGGNSTQRQAFREHIRYVHPKFQPPIAEEHVETEISAGIARDDDLHYHAWTSEGFMKLLVFASQISSFQIIANLFIVNENIFVLKKL